MCRNEFPRLFELRDLLPDPLPDGVAIPALDNTLIEWPQKKQYFQQVESDLQGLDAQAWTALQAKLTPWPKRHKTRVLEPLYDTLNEAKAYNYLKRIGCVDVHFVPVSPVKGQKTPDLGAEAQGRKVLCVVKTFNRSDAEIARSRCGGVATSIDQLSPEFMGKLKKTLAHANEQMLLYDRDARKIAYVFINYDVHEYADRYLRQLDQYQANNPILELELVFDTHPFWY